MPQAKYLPASTSKTPSRLDGSLVNFVAILFWVRINELSTIMPDARVWSFSVITGKYFTSYAG